MNGFLLKFKQNLKYFLLELKYRRSRTYALYKLIGVIFLMYLLVFSFNEELGRSIKSYVGYLIGTIFIYAFSLFVYRVLKFISRRWYGKIIYAIIGYFAFASAISLAKEIIYLHTKANPDGYQASIHFLAGLMVIPAWMTYVIFIAQIFMIIAIIIQFISFFFFFFKKKFKPLNEFVKNKIGEVNERKYWVHFVASIFGILVMIMVFSSLNSLTKSYMQSNLIKYAIVKHSYYPNYNTCNNKKISQYQYIKLLSNNKVSVANFLIQDDMLNSFFSMSFGDGKKIMFYPPMECRK